MLMLTPVTAQPHPGGPQLLTVTMPQGSNQPNPSTFGQTVTFTATVSCSAGCHQNQQVNHTPPGRVQFRDQGTVLGDAPLLDGASITNPSATATFPFSQLSADPHTITAVYQPSDPDFSTNDTPSVTQTVNQVGTAPTTTTLVSSANPSTAGQSVTYTATVTAATGTPTGNVTFKDGANTLGTQQLSGNTASFPASGLSVGSHSITAVYNGDPTFAVSISQPLAQTVNQGTATTTTTALVSSANPSTPRQPVTFTATVTAATGTGTPTGTVNFNDGGILIGTSTLSGNTATFTTSSLTLGTHSITATFVGTGSFVTSTSRALLQSVNTPADSLRLRALQLVVTKIEAQSSGQAISSAVDSAIAEGFSDSGALITPSANGLRFNFAAEMPKKSNVEERIGDTFTALGYAGKELVTKAPQVQPSPNDWLGWAEVRGIGWNTNLQAGDIRGGQTNALLGLTRRMSPNLLVGVFGGYEVFDYTSQLLSGKLKGNGWTAGAYLGWMVTPGLRFDAGVARSGISYDGQAGTALGSFPGQRWLVSGGLTGIYPAYGIEIEPSARVYALWERDGAFLDGLGTPQTERNFSSGRASAGTKVTIPLVWSSTITVAPYVGIYADYYFNKDDAIDTLLLPTQFIQGWSARMTSGLSLATIWGWKLAIAGEVGGLGSGQFLNWTGRGRLAVPF